MHSSVTKRTRGLNDRPTNLRRLRAWIELAPLSIGKTTVWSAIIGPNSLRLDHFTGFTDCGLVGLYTINFSFCPCLSFFVICVLHLLRIKSVIYCKRFRFVWSCLIAPLPNSTRFNLLYKSRSLRKLHVNLIAVRQSEKRNNTIRPICCLDFKFRSYRGAIAQCYCSWKSSHTNTENLLKWLKMQLFQTQALEWCYCGLKLSHTNSSGWKHNN